MDADPRDEPRRAAYALIRVLVDHAEAGDDDALRLATAFWNSVATHAELTAFFDDLSGDASTEEMLTATVEAAQAGNAQAAALCRKLRRVPTLARFIDAAEVRRN